MTIHQEKDSDISFSSCPFCDFASLAVIFENSLFFAVCNKYPIVAGHSLIIPKRHVEQYLALTHDENLALTNISRQLIAALLATYETDAFDYALQEGVWAGRSIGHLHFHVIPRKQGDLSSPGDWYPELVLQRIDPSQRDRVELDFENMKRVARMIREHGKAFG